MEVDRVLNTKFPGSTKALENLLSIFNAQVFQLPGAEDVKRHRDRIRDKHDVPVIATAIAAKPDLFVTGDRDFFTSDVISVVRVVTTREALEIIG